MGCMRSASVSRSSRPSRNGADAPAPRYKRTISVASATKDTHTQHRNAMDSGRGGVDDRESLKSQALINDLLREPVTVAWLRLPVDAQQCHRSPEGADVRPDQAATAGTSSAAVIAEMVSARNCRSISSAEQGLGWSIHHLSSPRKALTVYCTTTSSGTASTAPAGTQAASSSCTRSARMRWTR